MQYTLRPTCGHVSLTYTSLRLAKAHARNHAATCGAPIYITRDNPGPELIDTINPRTVGPFLTCRPQGEHDPMWKYDD